MFIFRELLVDRLQKKADLSFLSHLEKDDLILHTLELN